MAKAAMGFRGKDIMRFSYSAIGIMLLLIISMNISATPGADNNTVSIRKINASFINLCRSNKFSGVTLIAINGKIRFKKACGLASRNFHVPNTVATKFNLGSVGKLFTIVSIAQLIEAKKLSLNTKVYHLIPSWLKMKSGNLITVEQLLIHTSGLGNFMDDERWKLGADSGLYLKTEDYNPLISHKKLYFKPGSSQVYSNSGYLLLGKVMEKLSHLTYPQYIRRHIFNVANMADTGIYPLDEAVQNRAVGYYYSCKKRKCMWKNNYFESPFVGTSAGGAYASAGDLFRFSQALYHHKLLTPKLTKQVLSAIVTHSNKNIFTKDLIMGGKRVPENFSSYGFAGAWNTFGFSVWKQPMLVGHTGGTKGAAALFLMSPDNHYVIIILSNINNGAISLYKKIRDAFGFKKGIKNF